MVLIVIKFWSNFMKQQPSRHRHILELLAVLALAVTLVALTATDTQLSPLTIGALVCGYLCVNIIHLAISRRLHPETITHSGLGALIAVLLLTAL